MRPTKATEQIPDGAVVLWVECIVKPEHREAFLEAIWGDANGALDKEPGCLRFDVTVDSTNPNRFMLFEVYESPAARQIHRAAPYLKPVAAGLDEWLSEPSELTVAAFMESPGNHKRGAR